MLLILFFPFCITYLGIFQWCIKLYQTEFIGVSLQFIHFILNFACLVYECEYFVFQSTAWIVLHSNGMTEYLDRLKWLINSYRNVCHTTKRPFRRIKRIQKCLMETIRIIIYTCILYINVCVDRTFSDNS